MGVWTLDRMCVWPAAAGRLPFSNNQCKLLSKSCEKSDTHIRFRITIPMRCIDRRTLGAASRSLDVAAAHSVDLARFVLLLGAGVRPRRRLPTTRGVHGGQEFSAVQLFGFELSFGPRASRSERSGPRQPRSRGTMPSPNKASVKFWTVFSALPGRRP